MADDQASQRRSRLAPPPTTATSGASNTFRAPPPTATTGSRFGFGSSAPRTGVPATASTAARASTLSTARTSTFSSSAFGRSTFATKTPATSVASATAMQRPSSAETAGSRLRQKPTSATAAAAATATSAPKQATATSDLFATLASDVPPRSASGSSLPFAMDSSAASSFPSSYTANAVASKAVGQLFSMDDSDLGGDDGWGVDSPSNILSPASATDETGAASGTSKPFEDEDEFGWANETPAAAPLSSPVAVAMPFVPEPTSVTSARPSMSVPELKFEELASTPAVTTTTSTTVSWGDVVAYSADATEVPADEIAWNDENEWGTSAPRVNGAVKPATEAVAEAPTTPVEPTVAETTPAYIQAPPLSTASADLGAMLSPSGLAGELWGGEGDDLLFSDEEQPDATPLEMPLPNIGGLSLDSRSTSEERKPEEPVPVSPVAGEFSYQETEINGAVTEAVAETSEWEEDDGWGDQLRLSEVDSDIPFSPQPPKEFSNASYGEDVHDVESTAPEDAVPAVSAEQTLEAEVSQTTEFGYSGASAHAAEESIHSTTFFDQHAYSSHNEPHGVQATEESTPFTSSFEEHAQASIDESHEVHATMESTPSSGFFEGHADYSYNESQAGSDQHAEQDEYGVNNSYSYENHVENDADAHQQFEHHNGEELHHHHSAENGSYVDEQAQITYPDERENVAHSTSENGGYEEQTQEAFQRQVSWETRDDELDTSVDKAATVEDNQGQSSFVPPSVSSNKAEVSFGTSSFAAAELTYGHYHHDHHRTPSEAEVGSVASFAEASSAGATFGGSDHVSDGTYSDGGDFASETRSVFGNSSAHSTAFITEPASSSDDQASNEENGTYDHQSDMSSTVGGGGGAPSSEFDVSSTRSALFENEVASTGFEQGDEAYDYGDHGHHNHFEGSYENEYSHDVTESSTEFTEQPRSAFEHTDKSVFSNSGFGTPSDPQQSPSPMYSRSSTPATYGVSSSQDLPTASDLEFDHTDTENLFASSSSHQDSTPFGETYATEIHHEPYQVAIATPSVAGPSPLFDSDMATDDANPFASSGSGFPSPPAPPSFAAPPSDTSAYCVTNSADETLPSADSLFGASPAKNSPFGSFATSPAPQPGPVPYEDAPVSDAGSLFTDAPAAPVFGVFQQPTPASASSFFGGGQVASDNYGYDSAASQYGYDNSSQSPPAEEFGDSNQSHDFETGAYGYESSHQSANEAFGDQPQSNDYEGSYGYDAHPHQSAAEAFGAPASAAFGGHSNTGFGSTPGDAVNANSVFGGGNLAPTSAADMFGSSGELAHEYQPGLGYHHGEEHASVEGSLFGREGDQYPASSGHQVFEHYVTDNSATIQGFAPQPTNDHGELANDGRVESETPEASPSDSKDFALHSEYHQEYPPQSEEEWSYGAQTESHSFEGQRTSFSVAAVEASTTSEQQAEPLSTDHGYSAFGGAHDADSFFGRSASAPPNETLFSATAPPSGDERFASFPPRSTGSPPRAATTPRANPSFESVSASLREQPKSRVSETHSYPAVPSNDAYEAGSQAEFSTPFVDQSQHEGVEDHFGGGAAYVASPFEQSAEPVQQSDPSAFFGGQTTSGAFGEATSAEQTADPTQHSDPSAFFGGESTDDAFGGLPTCDQNIDSTQLSDPSAFFGGESTGGGFGETAPYEQSVDSAQQSDPSAFFGGQQASSAFGEAAINGASGFFSGGPSHHHHAGGIYAHLPQDSATPAYQGYDSALYGRRDESHAEYNNQTRGFASGNQSASTGAHQTAPQAGGVVYGSSAPHAYRSPTAVGASHFVSAQSTSAFEYHNATGAVVVQNTYPEGQHPPHLDASYRTPTLQPSAGPTTPITDPSPLHGTKAQPNYNQFAPTPAYGMTYESKPAYAHAAGNAVALTSNKHKDPNMVAPSCLASFGFGGNVVTMFPKQKLRLNSASFAARSSPRTPQSMQYDSAPQGELRKGPIGVYRMDHVHPRNSEFEELDKFPGPLNESVTEESILQYVEEKMNSAAGSTHHDEDERLLLGVLRVVIKCNGRLRSDTNSNPSEPSSPEVQLVSLLKESDQRRRRNHPSNFPQPKPVQYPAHPDAMLRNASRVRELLLLGDRKAAVDVAIQAQMWPEAMLIGSFTDKDEYKRVLCAYFASHYAPGDPCRALYLSFADQQERSVHEPQKLMQHNIDENSSEILSSWVVHVQMLLANRTADTNKILVELGDRLWKEAHAVVAAHVCYLLAGNTVEAPSPSSKIALLGADHKSPDEARFYVSPSAVQRTEIYEWVQKRINPAATNMIPFQGYKLIYAMILADHGKLETAFKYVNSMLTVIRAITATMKPGTSMYLEGMQNQLVVLDDRLRQHLGQDRADSVAAAASAKQGKQWGLGSALSIMGKIVNRVVEGNDASQQAAAPRSSNGSLFPGAPRSNNNNVNAPPEYPSGAAVGYSSQSGPSMVPVTAPGSGRGGGHYAAHPAPYNHANASHPMVAPPPVQAPSVPTPFSVPRQLSGRNSAPPHQPTPDYPAPTSGSGGNAYPAPLSGGNGFNAPPPQPPQPPPSFPQNSYNQSPVVEAPPRFQKPALDLSGTAGKSGFGNEPVQADASKPKSPPRSPRARGDGAPGSDKGSASPKAKEAPKKGGRSKTPPPSRSSSGWLSGISTFIATKMNPDAKVAKLGEHMDAYFDEEKKRWVFPGETQTDEPTMPSAPPTGPLPGSTPGSSSGGPPGGPPGVHSAPGSMAGGAAADDPLAALMAPPPARALMKKDPLAAMMAPPPNRTAFGQRPSTMPAKRPPPRPQFAVFKPAPGSQASSAPSEQGPPSSSGEPVAPPQ